MHSFICGPESSSNDKEGDLLVAVAALVTEARIPGPSECGATKSKDFHEGPHCNLITGVNRTHCCHIKNPLCEKFKRNRETILRLFKKGVPLCIEVLFTCVCKQTDADSLDNAVLLEQWYFSATTRGSSTTLPFNINQLISAIRSQLYFSQITAWLVTQDETSPITSDHLQYRLSSPDELLAPHTFSLTASKHEFPVSNLGNRHALSVSFLSAPRTSSSKPSFDCCYSMIRKIDSSKMDRLLDDRMHTSCTVKGKHCCEDIEDNDHQRLLKNVVKKPKSNHNVAIGHHNFNDLKPVPDKGQLLLDAIVRSGQKNNNNNNNNRTWPKKRSECDNFYCDMSESDKLFSRKEINCDSPIALTKKMMHTGARKKITFTADEIIISEAKSLFNATNARDIPSAQPDQAKFRRNLGNTVFHARTGLPLSSSPAPARKGNTRFDFDSSLNSVSAIKSALFSSSFSTDDESESDGSIVSPCSPEIYTGPKRELYPVVYRRKGQPTGLLGTFEESVLNGRLEPVSTVHGFTAELGASGSFVPKHIFVPVTAFFYAFGDHDRVSTPYLGHISLGKKGYNVPKVGTVQVTLFNPLGTVVKMFVLPYDLADMPPNSQTFIRQRTLYMPVECKAESWNLIPKWLRFLIHVRFMSSKSGKIYLHSDIRMIVMRKSDMDTATAHDIDMNYELRSFVHTPTNPRFSPRK